jgi:peptidyl-prolyl cis-trans isomerase D
MLDSFRKASKSWLAKALLILLIISFGAWGIGDYITGGGEEAPAIMVGDTSISTAYLRNELNMEVNALREQLGGSFTTEQAIQFGFLDRAIGRVVTEFTQVQTARDWGMVVPDEVVAQTIARTNAFQTNGQFDRQRFQAILAANSMTEAQYVATVRRDLLREALSQPVVAAATAPDTLVRELTRYRHQGRTGAMVTLAVADAPPPTEAPDPAALQQLYDDNIEAFTAPEYRAVTGIVLGLEDARPLVSVSEEAIQTAYEARQDEFTTPETRTVTQVLADDQAVAQAVAEAARAGTDLAEAAADAGAPAPVDMGSVNPTTLPPAQSDAVFALPEGGVSDPVESAFGWHVFKVRDVTSGGVQTLSEVREQIEDDLITRRAHDALYDLSVDLDDALGGGATLEEAAQMLDLDLVRLEAVDRQGRTPEGGPAADLPAADAFLATAFSAEPGEQTLMQETDAGYFVLRVDSVTPPAPRPLDEVRDRVAALWAETKKAEATRARGEAIVAAAREGRTLEAAAESVGATVRPVPPVLRTGETVEDGATAPPRPVVAALFGMDRGSLRLVEGDGAVYAVQLDEVLEPGETATDSDTARAETAEDVRASIADDLFIQFTDALSRQQGVEINRAVIEAAFR